LPSAFAETLAPSSTKVIQAPIQSVSTKTSDRTPDNPSPHRTAGASITGAAGTEAAHTPDGTSDRTPSNHYRPPTN
jgi:hypothetical protein